MSGDPRERSVCVVRAWKKLWCVGSQSGLLPRGHRFLLFCSYLVPRVSSLRPCPLKLSFSQGSSEFPKFLGVTCLPKAKFPLRFTVSLSTICHSWCIFKQTQCFNCLSFSSQSIRWLFFPVFCSGCFSLKKAKNYHLKLLCSTV